MTILFSSSEIFEFPPLPSLRGTVTKKQSHALSHGYGIASSAFHILAMTNGAFFKGFTTACRACRPAKKRLSDTMWGGKCQVKMMFSKSTRPCMHQDHVILKRKAFNINNMCQKGHFV